MKRSVLLFCILSPTCHAFLAHLHVSSRRSAEVPNRQAAGKRDGVAIALDSPGPTVLPKGKRVVRRKKRPQQPSQPAVVDTSKAKVQVSRVLRSRSVVGGMVCSLLAWSRGPPSSAVTLALVPNPLSGCKAVGQVGACLTFVVCGNSGFFPDGPKLHLYEGETYFAPSVQLPSPAFSL